MPEREQRKIFPETKRILAINLIEKLLPPIELKMRPGVTLDQAKLTESKSGDFQERANLYYSVLKSSENLEDRLNAMLGLSQELINLGRFGQAKRFLNPAYLSYVSSLNIDPRLGVYHSAAVLAKLGWIADNEGDFKESERNFTEVARKLEITSHAFRTPEEDSLHSTAIHFLGRAYFGQGDYFTASQYFQIHLDNPNLKKEEQGFSHGWLARCYMAMGDLEDAALEIERTRASFEEYEVDHPERGALATYFLLRGELFFRKGEFFKARDQFNLALLSRYTKGRYPKGESQALFGIAATYWAQRKIGSALIYAVKGFKTYPLSIIKP